MKKNLDVILLGVAAFFGLMIFVFMALPGLKAELIGTSTISVYKCMSDGAGVVTVGFIFMIVTFLVAAALLTFKLLAQFGKAKIEIPCEQWIALGVAVLAFVAFIMFWFVESSLYDGSTSEYIKLGAGSVLCALSSLFAAAGLGLFGFFKIKK